MSTTPTIHDGDAFARADALFSVLILHGRELEIPAHAEELLGFAQVELANFGRDVAVPNPATITGLDAGLAELQGALQELLNEAPDLAAALRVRAAQDFVSQAAALL